MTLAIGKRVIMGTVCLIALLFVPMTVRAEEEATRVYKTVLKSTAWVVHPVGPAIDGKQPIAMGTGSLIDEKKRIVLTNWHVVGDETYVFVIFPIWDQKGNLVSDRDPYMKLLNENKAIKAKVLVRNPKVDLALIQLEALPSKVQPLPLARETAVPGQKVYSIGNPGASGGGMWLLTEGSVRQVSHSKIQFGDKKTGLAHELDCKTILTSSPTNPGDSGGPLVNGKGELIGVTQGYNPEAREISIFVEMSEVVTIAKGQASLKIGRGPNTEVAEKPEPMTEGKTTSATDEAKPAENKAGSSKAADAKAADNEKRASAKLSIAKNLLEMDLPKDAKLKLEEIIKNYPETKAAAEAKELLAKPKK
jgi:hypothetical protein